MSDKLEKYFSAQCWFTQNIGLHESDYQNLKRDFFSKITDTMQVKQVGLWSLDLANSNLKEVMTFSNQPHDFSTDGLSFSLADLFFIKQVGPHLVDDHLREPNGFYDYLKNRSINSFLSFPIMLPNSGAHYLIIQRSGPHFWDQLDLDFGSFCSRMMSLLFETERNESVETALVSRIDSLEVDLNRNLHDLNEANQDLDLALEGAQVGKWNWDIKTGKLSLNRTWYTRLGYEYNELPQNLDSFISVVHPDDVKHIFDELNSHIKGEKSSYECRYRMITKYGEIQWCLDRGLIVSRTSDGSPLKMTGVNTNITPVVRLEQSLLASKQQLRSMIQSLPTAVAMLDGDFRYLAFSAKWKQEWGEFAHTEIGALMDQDSPIFRGDWIEYMEQGLKGEASGCDEDLIEITSELKLWLRWVIQPWKMSSGTVGGIIIMTENITDKKETEIRLNQASKLSALGEMAGGIAHEINNPLSIIKGYIDLLRRHSSRQSLNEDLLTQYISKMDQTVGRISRIVSGMRRFSRESSMDKKIQYSLNQIIEETLDICQERITNNGTAIDIQLFKDEPLILCRPIEISQVLLNLINNSFHAVNKSPRSWIKIRCRDLQEFYRISISDSGEGISSYVKQKLFQPFFTTKEVGTGTGLGLSISKGIIEEHEGRIYYQEKSANTTFVIELPKIQSKQDTRILS